MTINHRQIVRGAGYLARHPWTRRAVTAFGVLVLLASLSYNGPALAANSTKTVTTKADWEQGTLTSIDSESTPDQIQLADDGTWGAYSWSEPYDTIEQGSAFASDGTYVYAARGSSFNWLWRYDPSTNSWKHLADAPYAFGIGSDLRYGDADHIYAVFGLYSDKFAVYTISTDTWTVKAATPDAVGNGGSLTYYNNYLYLLRGYNSQDFYRYSIADNSWAVLSGTPSTTYNGADLVSGDNGYLYAFRGNNTLTFYRYDISGNSWDDAAAADLPSGGNMNGDGNAILLGGYIYKLRSAAQTTWYRYNITSNIWGQLTDLPLTATNGGLIQVDNLNKIYIFRGTSTRMFWEWDPTTSDFVGAAEPNISGTAYTNGTGANLISDGSQYIYYLRGGNTNNLLRYDSSGNSWSLLANATISAINYNFTYDTTGVKAGNYLYFFQGNNTNFLRYSIVGNTWSLLAATPANTSYGSTMAYPGSGDYIYALRGANTASFWRYSISGDTWDDAGAADLPQSSQQTLAYIGARIVSDGTDIYGMNSYGSSRFFKYTVGTDTWSELTNAPFPGYYGTALEYKSGKIYALAGYYKNAFYSYDISGNSWRRLADTQVTNTAKAGAYNGASLAVLGSTIYAIRGAAVSANTDFWTYTISSNNYVASGSYTSPVFDLSYVSAWVSLNHNGTTGSDSAVAIQTRSSADNVTWSAYQDLIGTSIQSAVNRYLQVKITLTASTDRATTPTVTDYTVTYTSDVTAPSNPDTLTALSQQVGGTALSSGSSYAYTAPYFSWTGASDAGSGLKGYYVYFGTDTNADPHTDGIFTANTYLTVNAAMATGSYYLRIKAVDNKDNIAATAWAPFTYVYSGVSPSSALQISSQAQFETGTLSSLSAAQSSSDLQLSSTAGSWREGSLTPPPGGIYFGGNFAYVGSSNKLYTFRGNTSTNFYSYDVASDTWSSETDSNFGGIRMGGGVVEGPSGYLYGWTGNSLSTFARYDIANQIWDDSAAADLPLTVTYGGFANYDGSRYVYFIRGSNDNAFWRYDTQNNNWATLANADFGNGANQNAYIDGYLAYDGSDTIYAVQGNNYPFVGKYTISTNSWSHIKPAPVGFYNGATLVYDSVTNSLYGLAGSSRGVFLKYSITNDEWTTLQSPPLYQGYGATQRLIGRDIYTLRGQNTTAFWKYNIDTGLWTKPVGPLFGPEYAGTIYYPTNNGASIVKGDGDYIYASRGNFDNSFVRYNRQTGEITALADIPYGVTTGGTLVYEADTGEIYATAGNNNKNFFKYSISGNTWTTVTTDMLPNTISDGSEMVYDGNGKIYLSRVAGAQFWVYDVNGTAGSRWSQMASSPDAPGAGGSMVRNSNYIYMARGANTASFYRYDISGNSWSDPLVADAPVNVTTGGFIADGDNGYIYLSSGTTSPGNRWYRYDIAGDSWSQLSNSPANWGTGSDGVGKNGEQILAFLGNGTNALSDSLYTYNQQTSTTSFVTSGSYTSAAHDLTAVYKWANLTATYTTPNNTTVTIKTQSSSDNSNWSSLTAVTNQQDNGNTHTFQIASPAAEYLRVEISMTSDGLYTPTLGDYTVNYYQDTTAPTNPSTITAYDSSGHAATLTTNTWYNYSTPEFVWGNGSDNAGGSGVEGYFVYFGTDNSADPQITSGIINGGSAVQFQSGTTLTLGSAMNSGSTYYLLVKTRDNAQNVSASAYNAFTYKYDSTAPTNPGSVSVSPAGYSASDNFTFSWTAGSDAQSGLLKYQYRTGGDDANTWTDMSPATNTSVTLPNGNHAQGQYQSGTNVFYLRTLDNAGNASSPVSANYYYSGSAPTPPQNVTIDPTDSTTNSFTVSWEAPLTYVGDQNQLSYYWSVNVLPTANNTTQTPATSVGPAALATQQGQNTFYVVAKDGAGNVDYSLYGSIDFTATTAAPSVPNNFTASDLSDRDTEKYGAALSWAAPTTYDAGNFAGYKVYQSSDGNTFTQVSTTTGTAYVDQNLTGGHKYYYKVTAYTKTNVESAATTILSVTPTGKFTSPPTIVSSSLGTTVYSRKVSFTWITTRNKGDGSGTSFVKCGLTEDDLSLTAGDFTQVLQHDVTIEGLTPSTAYKCELYSTDIDGNTATYGPMDITTAPPPVVQDLSVVDISLHSGRVNFTTNVDAKGTLNYGETSSFGNSITFDNFQRNFSVQLDNLKDTTTYYYGFTMTTRDGDTFGQEVINKFDTLPQPVVSNVKVDVVQNVDTPSLEITYSTNVQTTTSILYSTDGAKGLEATNSAKPLSLDHDITLNNLAAFKDYTLVVGGLDLYGNEAISQTVHAQTKGRTKPPQIANFSTENAPQTNGKTAIIARVETDEPTTAVMEVAQGSSAQSFSITSEESPLNQNHSLSLDVNSGTIYSVRVKLVDDYGNVAYTSTENVSGGVRKLTPIQIVTQTLNDNFGWLFKKWRSK